MNGLICGLEGELKPNTDELKSIGYEWLLVMNGYERINSLFQTILESDSISFGASLLEEYG